MAGFAPSPQIAFDDFLKVDIRVGTVVAAEPLAGVRHAALQPRLHERVPDRGVVAVDEALCLRDGALDHRAERRIPLLVGMGRHRRQGKQQRRQRANESVP